MITDGDAFTEEIAPVCYSKEYCGDGYLREKNIDVYIMPFMVGSGASYEIWFLLGGHQYTFRHIFL